MPWYNSQRRCTARTLPKSFVLVYVLFVLCRSVYCLCVNVFCTAATGWQPNCSLTNISKYIFIGGVSTYEVGTECSQTSAHKIQTTGNHPKEKIQHGLLLCAYVTIFCTVYILMPACCRFLAAGKASYEGTAFN